MNASDKYKYEVTTECETLSRPTLEQETDIKFESLIDQKNLKSLNKTPSKTKIKNELKENSKKTALK